MDEPGVPAAPWPVLSGSGSIERRDSGLGDCPCFVRAETTRSGNGPSRFVRSITDSRGDRVFCFRACGRLLGIGPASQHRPVANLRRNTSRLRAGENTNAIVRVLRTRRSQLAEQASPGAPPRRTAPFWPMRSRRVVYARDPLTPHGVTAAWWPLRCKFGSAGAGAESPLSRLQLVRSRLDPEGPGSRPFSATTAHLGAWSGVRVGRRIEPARGRVEPKTCSADRAVLPLRRGGAGRRPATPATAGCWCPSDSQVLEGPTEMPAEAAEPHRRSQATVPVRGRYSRAPAARG